MNVTGGVVPTQTVMLNLTTVQSLIRWRWAEPHPVLATAPTWYDESTRQELDRHALGELDRNNLLRGARPDAHLDDMVGVLVRPDRELYGWITTTIDGRPFHYGVLAAATYQLAVLAFRNHETDAVLLATIRPDELISAFVAQLPVVAPASGQPVRTPYQDFLAATEPAGDGFDGWGGGWSPAVRAVDAVLTQPRTGGGSLYTAGRAGSVGSRRRGRQPLNYLDTTTGRWLTQLDDTGDGLVATIRPASIGMIAAELADTERRLDLSE
jgi:EspG family